MNEAESGWWQSGGREYRQPKPVERSSAFRVRLNAGNVLFWLTDFLIVMLQRAKQTAGEGGSLSQGGVVTGHTMAIKCISLSDQRHARCGPPSAFAFAAAAVAAAFGLTQSSAGIN